MNGGVKVFGLLTLSIHLVFTVTRYYSSLPQSKDKYKKKRFEEEEQVIDGTSMNNVWSSLDPNLLGEILSRLCLTDQARFLVVCKNWLAAAHPIINSTTSSKSAAALPWHGCIVPGSSQVQIYDPLSSPNHLVSVENILWSKLGIPSPSHPLFASAAVKHNWLFLGIRKSNFFFWRRRYVLMYSPFTRRFITLPKFDYPRGFSFRSAFSTQPDSPDCVFCLVDGMNADKKIAVITYTNGDKEWTAREFNTHPHFIPDTCYPLILCGILYIVSTFGQVASYNILHGGEFNFESLFLDDLLLANRSAQMKMKSFVFNGELMILWYNGIDALPGGQQCVRRYDRSLKVWIPVSTLSDYALFFRENIIGVSVINTKDMRYNGVLSNKIYHFLNGGCLVYSLEDGNLVRFKSINSNLLEDGGGELPKYKYDYGIQDPAGYWLEAPCVRSSSYNQGKLSINLIH